MFATVLLGPAPCNQGYSSFALASTMSATASLWLRFFAVKDRAQFDAKRGLDLDDEDEKKQLTKEVLADKAERVV
jgi:hypothetical protein